MSISKALGQHILVEYYDCNTEVLTNCPFIEQEMNVAAEKCGATIVNSTFHTFSPYGVSGVVVIAESHLTIHTWPEHGYAAVDLFTCGEELQTDLAIDHLKRVLNSSRMESQSIERGVNLPLYTVNQ